MPARRTRRAAALAAVVAFPAAAPADAQWTNRYPKQAGYAHHVYFEGYELPVTAVGPSDPAPSPDGRSVAVASRGWLWLLDLASGEARRLTRGAGVDSRPAWSPDGRTLAFVRDDGRTTAVMTLDVTSGAEREVERGLALDPAFAPDGRSVYYASSSAGDLDLWRAELATGAKVRVTSAATGIELRPQPLADGRRVLYLSKTRGGADEVRVRPLEDGGAETTLLSGNILSQLRPAPSPDGRLLAYNWPGTDGWELRLTSLERPGPSVLLVGRPGGRPLAPAWSRDRAWVYFAESDGAQRMRLYRVSAAGGAAAEVPVRRWVWGAPTGRLVVRTRGPDGSAVAARLAVADGTGHPALPDSGQARFDGQNGVHYFYSPGAVTLEVPAGEVTVTAVRGLATPPAAARATVAAGETREVTLELAPVWDARAAGWYSGDHHFHLNYGGPFALRPDDLLPLLAGEDLDVATPMLANLHTRFEDQALWGWRRVDRPPFVAFAQEVRSHFLGHVGLIGTRELVWPWIWGPGYEVYGRDDRTNAAALAAARRQGGLGIYVHPVTRPDPFASDAGLASIPLEYAADVAHGAVDLIEVACLWSDELGTSDLWYRALNLGVPIAPEAGTDAMTDFGRTMAVGTTRVYVRPDGPFTYERYLAALKAGRSFVTTGPMLDFRVRDARPGDVLPRGGAAPFTLELHTAQPVERVEVLVNGVPAWRGAGVDSAGSRRFAGTVTLPAGGWIAARAVGPATTRWPAMDSYAFAHTAPVWIGRVGSTDAAAARAAARDLLRALDVAERRLVAGYEGTEIPALRAHFAAARRSLEARAGTVPAGRAAR